MTRNPLDARLAVAHGLLAADRPADAAALCREMLAGGPADDRVSLLLGLAEQRRGELPAARQVLAALVARRPDFAAGWSAYGQLLAELDQPDDAELALRLALSLAPDQPAHQLTLARLLAARQRTEEAAELAMAAALRQPDDVAGLEFLAAVLATIGRLDDAREIADRALRMAPDSPLAQAVVQRHRDAQQPDRFFGAGLNADFGVFLATTQPAGPPSWLEIAELRDGAFTVVPLPGHQEP